MICFYDSCWTVLTERIKLKNNVCNCYNSIKFHSNWKITSRSKISCHLVIPLENEAHHKFVGIPNLQMKGKTVRGLDNKKCNKYYKLEAFLQERGRYSDKKLRNISIEMWNREGDQRIANSLVGTSL